MVAHALVLIRDKYFDSGLDPNQIATVATLRGISEGSVFFDIRVVYQPYQIFKSHYT